MRRALFAALLLLAACTEPTPPSGQRRPDPPEGTVRTPPVSVTGPAAAQAVASRPLERAVGLTFGLPLPEDLELVQRTHDVAEFVTEHSAEALVEFYTRELPHHRQLPRSDGVKFEARDEDRADVYVVDGEDLRRVYYFRAEQDLPEPTLEAAAGEQAPGSSPPEWRQGPVAPPGLDAFLSPVRSQESGAGPYYDERIEEVDGQRVRVLTVRDPTATRPSQPAQPTPPAVDFPAQWHQLPQAPGRGSYDRGDGHRSLRGTPQRGPDGQPLPYFGDRRVEFDPESTAY